MSRIAAVIAYDGTDFSGWQRQAGLRTVQGDVEDAIARIVRQPLAVHGASRTDAGVHALGQVVHADVPEPWGSDAETPRRLMQRLNALLRGDVRVRRLVPIDDGFHARKSAIAKLYRYEMQASRVASPFQRRFRHHVRWRLDVDAMAAAAPLFVGRRDFASLQTAGSSVTTTVREITACRVRRRGSRVTVEVQGSGFLRHMVRALVGSLLEVGRGRQPPEWVAGMLDAADRAAAGANVPPAGLFLAGVRYAAHHDAVIAGRVTAMARKEVLT